MINGNRKYSVSDPDTIRKACIDSGWFTDGTVSQYEKLFYANENRWPLEKIATIIWLCSDSDEVEENAWEAIKAGLCALRAEYLRGL